MKTLLALTALGVAGYVAYRLQKKHVEQSAPQNARRHLERVLKLAKEEEQRNPHKHRVQQQWDREEDARRNPRWRGTKWEDVA